MSSFQDSDGDKSDDLVVDVSNEVRLYLSQAAQPHSTQDADEKLNTTLFCH